MKRVVFCISLVVTLLTFSIPPVYAQLAPSPKPDLTQSQEDNSATISPKENAIQTITTIKDFVTSADKLLGGFIFYTPDVFANTITLKDGTVLPGLSSYRNIFYAISIPLIAIAIAYFAFKRLADETPYALHSLIKRLIIIAALFIVTPILLSYSIQANNLLVNQITANQTFSTFITDFLNNEVTQINNGANPAQFGIPQSQPNILLNQATSVWQHLLQIILFLISLLFFIFGFLFIAFQFIIRFASLLFLSVIYPLAIPFALSEKTEGITNTYFKTWFMFLIHQPAFALAYMLAIGFLQAILKVNGASLGMLFFYSGFLFFLGGVSTLVTHLFGSSWTAISTNLQAAIITSPFTKSVSDFNKGAIRTSAAGIGNFAKKQTGYGFNSWMNRNGSKKRAEQNTSSFATAGFGGYTTTGSLGGKSSAHMQKVSPVPSKPPTSSQSIPQQTTSTGPNASHNQTMKVNQTGFSVENKKTGVTTTYLTKQDAKADGYRTSQLKNTTVDGKYLNFTHQASSTTPSKIRDLLNEKNKLTQENVAGILHKSKARKSNYQIIRIYTKEDK